MAETKRPDILPIFADDWGKLACAYAKAGGSGGINDVSAHLSSIAGSGKAIWELNPDDLKGKTPAFAAGSPRNS